MEELQYQTESSEYAEAFRSTRLAKNLFWWLIFAALIIQLAGFALVRFAKVIDPLEAMGSYDAQAVSRAQRWGDVLLWVLSGSKFLAVAASMLLILTLLFAVKLSLLGRQGGVAGLVSAFFWSLILFAMVIPWQQAPETSFAAGAVYNLQYLIKWTKTIRTDWGAACVYWWDQVLYYARFIAFPAVAAMVWLIVGLRFARGVRRMRLSPEVVSVRPSTPERPEAGEL